MSAVVSLAVGDYSLPLAVHRRLTRNSPRLPQHDQVVVQPMPKQVQPRREGDHLLRRHLRQSEWKEAGTLQQIPRSRRSGRTGSQDRFREPGGALGISNRIASSLDVEALVRRIVKDPPVDERAQNTPRRPSHRGALSVTFHDSPLNLRRPGRALEAQKSAGVCGDGAPERIGRQRHAPVNGDATVAVESRSRSRPSSRSGSSPWGTFIHVFIRMVMIFSRLPLMAWPPTDTLSASRF